MRRNALPQPGRILELLALCSRLHSTLLDRHRPLWEMHLIEGLDDGRYAIYFKVHHSLVDGVSALRMLPQDAEPATPTSADMPPPWAPRAAPPARAARARRGRRGEAGARRCSATRSGSARRSPAPSSRALKRPGRLACRSPRRSRCSTSPITGARRFAAQSWPMERDPAASARPADATVNDVVLAMCSGALRNYMLSLDALPDAPLIAMVPVSLHGSDERSARRRRQRGRRRDVQSRHRTWTTPAERLATVHRSMDEGKEALRTMTPTQILAMSALGVSPLAVWPALRLTGTVRPPFNLVISNVPGPREPMYWNGARLDGLYPLSIPLDGQALNITCTSYSERDRVRAHRLPAHRPAPAAAARLPRRRARALESAVGL